MSCTYPPSPRFSCRGEPPFIYFVLSLFLSLSLPMIPLTLVLASDSSVHFGRLVDDGCLRQCALFDTPPPPHSIYSNISNSYFHHGPFLMLCCIMKITNYLPSSSSVLFSLGSNKLPLPLPLYSHLLATVYPFYRPDTLHLSTSRASGMQYFIHRTAS